MTALSGLRVIELATIVAGPGAARYLADFGADVIKVESPERPDSLRAMPWRDPRDDVSLWWKLEGRNKRSVALDLRAPEGLDAFKRLCASADVLIENLRPGKLEALGLDPSALIEANPKMVITRVTAFGQDGPYCSRPGFATLAEAMSGFAAVNGEPDGAPLLPPIALTDEVTALAAAFATLVAVHSGVGQVVDVNLLESMLQMMGPAPAMWVLNGYLQPRLGSGIPYSVPRSTYRCSDGRWVAVSTSAESVAARVMELIGLGGDSRFDSFEGRVAHREEVDDVLGDWIASRSLDEVLLAFEEIDAAAAPVYTMSDIVDDEHLRSRDALVEVEGVVVQGPIAKLSATPGEVKWLGRPLGADTAEVLAEVRAEVRAAARAEVSCENQ